VYKPVDFDVHNIFRMLWKILALMAVEEGTKVGGRHAASWPAAKPSART
jgi:hypothetical protein